MGFVVVVRRSGVALPTPTGKRVSTIACMVSVAEQP